MTATILLRVDAMTGHYRMPGQANLMQTVRTFPVVPYSTVRGFVESLLGMEWMTLRGIRLAIGVRQPPRGRGDVFRKDHAWASDGVGDKGEMIRPVHRETLFFPSYRIGVEGDSQTINNLRAALRGEVDRYGLLYLGESEDLVDWVGEETGSAKWLVPGVEIALPVRTVRGWDNLNSTYGRFNLVEAEAPPPEAWVNPDA